MTNPWDSYEQSQNEIDFLDCWSLDHTLKDVKYKLIILTNSLLLTKINLAIQGLGVPKLVMHMRQIKVDEKT
jgi:hypothetical protein